MKINVIICLLMFLLQNIYSQSEKRLVILHTNDMHSRLEGFGPEADYSPLTINDDRTTGGFARIASLIRDEKLRSPGETIVLDAGDFLMGTLFQALETETGFQLNLMKRMGYDVTCIGNHEYDFGPASLASIIKSASLSGEMPAILLGNASFSEDDPSDDGLSDLYRSEILTSYCIMEVNDIRIGLFSLLGEDAVSVAPNAKPVKFGRQIPYAKKMVKELKQKGCEIIICLSHSGLKRDEASWSGEDKILAGKVPGLNLIISGHTHSLVSTPLIVNGVPIVQAGDNGNYVGRLELKYSEGKITVESYSLIPVDDKIAGDPEIENLINDQKVRITSQLLEPLGLDYKKPVAESAILLEDNEYNDPAKNNLGPFVADAIHYYINSESQAGTDMSMVSAGVLREKILPGKITVPDIFRVVSLGSGRDNIPGYPLSRLYITGKELKNVLEVLLIASGSSHDYYCYYSGIRVEYDPEKGFLRKISSIKIERGGKLEDVNLSKKDRTLYSVSANSYMLAFIGIIKKKTFGLAKVIPRDAGGNPVKDMSLSVIDFADDKAGIQEGKEWIALLRYLQQMKDVDGDGLPDLDTRYLNPRGSFEVVKQIRSGN